MESALNTLIITQARTGSTRLPNKVLLQIKGEELLITHLERLKKCKLNDKLIVATTSKKADDLIISLCDKIKVDTYRGSEHDVLDRFYQASVNYQPKWVVRVTSDCPLIDPDLVDAVIAFAQTQDLDYFSNGIVENFPDGQDVEVFKFSALEKAWKCAILKSEREHVTSYIRNNSNVKGGEIFQAMNFPCYSNLGYIRMTVDEKKDFELIEKLIHDLGKDKTWKEYTHYIIENKLNNNNILRNEGYLKSVKND